MISRINILIAVTVAVVISFISVLWFYQDELGIPTTATAQEGASDYAYIFADEAGDDEVIAIVGANSESVITRGDLRVMAEAQTVHQQNVSVADVFDESLVARIDSAVLYAEAVRLGHLPSDEAVQSYMEFIKVACDGPDGAPCRQIIKEQGYENREDYWEVAVEGYAEGMAVASIRHTYLNRLYPDGATEEQEDEALAAYEKSLRDTAIINWKDSELKAKYDALTVSETDFDETGQDKNSDSDNADETASNDDGEKNGEVSDETDSDGTDTSEDTDGGVADDGEGIGRPEATATPVQIF